MPCFSHNLVCYVVFLTQTLAASSIACYLNVMHILHLQCGFPNSLQDPLFKFQKELLMRGIKRLLSSMVWQKLPITTDILHKLHRQLDLINMLDATFWATCVIAFFSFFRKSNLLIASTNSCDPLKHLCMCDICVYNWGLMVVVRWSKTIQYRNCTLLVSVSKIDHSKLCPHKAIVHTFKLLAAHDSAKLRNGPAFVCTSKLLVANE